MWQCDVRKEAGGAGASAGAQALPARHRQYHICAWPAAGGIAARPALACVCERCPPPPPFPAPQEVAVEAYKCVSAAVAAGDLKAAEPVSRRGSRATYTHTRARRRRRCQAGAAVQLVWSSSS